MLPSRPRLEGWNPDSLTFTGQSVSTGGQAVGDAVTRISTNINTMPETKAWSGQAHAAADKLFGRAATQTQSFTEYTGAVATALGDGAGTIGAARTAQQEQVTVNGLLSAVGSADDKTADAITAAAQKHGFAAPDPTSLENLVPGVARPSDEVPNPMTTTGLMQQAVLRDAEMAQTVRETTVETRYDPETGAETATVTTIHMMDGSKVVRTVNAEPDFPDRGPLTTEVHFNKDGNKLSTTTSVTYKDWAGDGLGGVTSSTTVYKDGTIVTLRQSPDGTRSGTIRTPDGRQADVPINLFDHPVMSPLSAVAGEFPGGQVHGPRGGDCDFPVGCRSGRLRVREMRGRC